MAATSWKDIVGAVAPSIATLFGGPLAGVAVKALSEKLLGKPDGTEDEVAQAVASLAPADLLKLKEVEADLTKTLADIGVRQAQVDASDRDSARRRQIETKDLTPALIALLVLCGYGAVMYRLMAGGPLTGDQQILWMMFGTLTAAVTQVLNYFLGSTSQSAKKNDTIAQAIKGQAG